MALRGRVATSFGVGLSVLALTNAVACGDESSNASPGEPPRDAAGGSTSSDAGDASVGGNGNLDGSVDADANAPAVFVSTFDGKRQCTVDGELWEICFDGLDLPGHGVAPHLAWDNPVDDAWVLGATRQNELFINQKTGPIDFLRAAMPPDSPTAGANPMWFQFRDPELLSERGIDILLRIRIANTSEDFAVNLTHYDEAHEFTLHFNPSQIVFHPVLTTSSSAAGAVVAPLDLTQLREFVIRKLHGSSTVIVREKKAGLPPVNPFSTPLAAAAGANSGKGRPYSETVFGTRHGGGVFELSRFNMRRELHDVWPAVLPDRRPATQAGELHFEHAVGVSAAACPADSFDSFAELAAAPTAGAPCQLSVRTIADGAVEPPDLLHCVTGPGGVPSLASDGTLLGGTIAVHDLRLDLDSGGAIEWRFRFVEPLAPGAMVSVSGVHGPGAFTLLFSADTLTPASFGKPVLHLPGGSGLPYVDGWNTIRLVRPAASIYVYVYLNGTLVLRDYKLAFRADLRHDDPGNPNRPGVSFLGIGTNPLPSPSEAWALPGNIPGIGWGAAAAMEVDCVRWSLTPDAPLPLE
jgi:hypothetical protein